MAAAAYDFATDNPDLTQRLLDAAEAELTLKAYTQLVWSLLEPGKPLVWGWHLDVIAEHLEAITAGELRRVVFNVPPGFSKSLMTNVLWPSWEWGPKDMPWLRYISFAYAQQLTIRDNRRCRNLITSPLYQKLWGDRFYLVSDQNAKVRYDTNASGFRLASSVTGTGTGERGDRIVIDDPNNVTESESEKITESTLTWLTEVIPSRTNDIRTSAIVVIQQRTGVNDVTGHILKSDLGYEWVCYDDQTEILTEVGWRAFCDLLPGCRVMGVDPATLRGQWEKPLHYIRKEYHGDLIRWASMTADLAVTPEHRVIYGDANDGPRAWRVRAAEDVPQDFYIPQALSEWDGYDGPVTLGGRTWGPLVYAAFMGWFLSEGNASAKGCYTLISQKTGASSDEIARVLDICPFSWQRYDYPGKVGRFQIGSKQLARDLQPLGTSHTKRIPRRLIDMSRKVLDRFLGAYIAGDGHLGGIYGDRPSVTTASAGMADDLQELGVKLGWAASIEAKGAGHYVVHFRRSKSEGRLRKGWAKLGASHRSRVEYHGEVFCVSVPSTALVVRRNGRVAVSGNCLPMEYERARPCFTTVRPKRRTASGKPQKPEKVRLVKLEEESVPQWMPAKKKPVGLVSTEGPVRTLYRQDRRTKEGETLDPVRFPADAVESDLKRPLQSRGGTAAVAGQLQQRPQARGGSMFKREGFQFVELVDLPPNLFPARGYDLAGTGEKVARARKSAYSVGAKLAVDFLEDDVYILDVARVRYEPGQVVRWMQALAEQDGKDCLIDFPQDPAQAGKWQVKFLGGKLAGFRVFSSPESGSKEDRAQPFASQAQLGNVYLLRAAWNDAFIAEAVNFPRGDYKDQIDAVARAYARALTREKRAPTPVGPKVAR